MYKAYKIEGGKLVMRAVKESRFRALTRKDIRHIEGFEEFEEDLLRLSQEFQRKTRKR